MGRFFKFKSASQPERIFDIILNRRLFCAPVSSLNDPTEGVFAYSSKQQDQKLAKKFSKEVSEEIEKLRICSLSRTHDSHLLWAHYATGFNGVAIELDLEAQRPEVYDVTYGGVFAGWNFEQSLDPKGIAHEVMLTKGHDWAYEQESRIVQSDQWYHLERPVQAIIAGHRVDPALFDAMQIVAEQQGIKFHTIGIGDEGLDVDRISNYQTRVSNRQLTEELG